MNKLLKFKHFLNHYLRSPVGWIFLHADRANLYVLCLFWGFGAKLVDSLLLLRNSQARFKQGNMFISQNYP